MSAITDYELELGVLALQRRDPRQALALRRWLDTLRLGLGSRILPVSPEIARTCAALNVPDRRPWADALIAATALHHGLTLVTRNEKDFAIPGLAVVNPFSG
ncbi:putative nucleic acid-binding protein [Microbacterium foliorum]|nr:putative nucleic acid-binding protein [Microbacterium foliorum]